MIKEVTAMNKALICPFIASNSDSFMGFPFDGDGVVEHPLSNDCGTPPSHFEQGHEVVD